jgi:hypothetical protein
MSGDSPVTNNSEGPSNIVGEAAMWLRGLGPYTYGNSTGKVDTNNDGVLVDGGSNNFEFNKNSGAFTGDANFTLSGSNPLLSSLSAWFYDVDVDETSNDIHASGEDLLHALQSFNGQAVAGGDNGHLVVSPQGNKVGWYDHVTLDVIGIPVNNSPDAFWGVLDAHYGI